MIENRRNDMRAASFELLVIPYCPVKPTAAQSRFLLDLDSEALYGGAAGGGKSLALLMGALQFVDVPGYRALLLRRTLVELQQPGGLLDAATSWLSADARWNPVTYTFTFRSAPGSVDFCRVRIRPCRKGSHHAQGVPSRVSS